MNPKGPVCQSCGMPMEKPGDFVTNVNGRFIYHSLLLLVSPAAIIVTMMRIVKIVERKRIWKIGIRIVI